MRIDLKALGISFLTFLIIYLPIYLRFTSNNFIATFLSSLAPLLPYFAAFFSGLTLAYFSKFNQWFNSLLLTALISLSLGFANYFLPSDLPGFYYSAWISALSFPIALFLVVAGLGAKSLMKAVSNEFLP